MKKVYSLILSCLAVFLLSNSIGFSQVVIADSSFEAGTPSTSWIESSTNFGTPLCDGATCGTCGGPCTPHTGTWYIWIGGISTAVEEALASQAVLIPTATDTTWLKFWYKVAVANGTGTDVFAVIIDTDTIFKSTDADSTLYANWTELKFDVSSKATGTGHTVKVWGKTFGPTRVTNFLLDDIQIRGNSLVGFEGSKDREFVNVTPSPASTDMNIEISLLNQEEVNVEILSITGASMLSKDLGVIKSGNLTVDVSQFAAGTYFVKVRKGSENIIKKVIVE